MHHNEKSTESIEQASPLEGCVFNIQRFTVHDGPGIRTEIFLKGCPLKCRWCSNPESMYSDSEIGVYASRCIGKDKCGYCITACPIPGKSMFILDGNLVVGILQEETCSNCRKCAEACPSNALMVWGKKMTLSDVMKPIKADTDFYRKSNGGVTISGGEPLLQWEYTVELLKECRQNGIHTCLESSLHIRPEILDRVYPFADMVITDIKHMDSSKHRDYTGVGNDLILANIIKTAKFGKPLIIRIPVIPDHNDDEENIRATAKFILDRLENKVIQVQLLAYRPLGVEKYKSLGRAYPMDYLTPPERSIWEMNIKQIADLMQSYGIPAVAGTTVKPS